jgi:hypothetical protein
MTSEGRDWHMSTDPMFARHWTFRWVEVRSFFSAFVIRTDDSDASSSSTAVAM